MPTFSRCLHIISTQLAATAEASEGRPTQTDPDKQAITCALDLVSGITEAMGASMESLVAAGPLVDLLMRCCQVGLLSLSLCVEESSHQCCHHAVVMVLQGIALSKALSSSHQVVYTRPVVYPICLAPPPQHSTFRSGLEPRRATERVCPSGGLGQELSCTSDPAVQGAGGLYITCLGP